MSEMFHKTEAEKAANQVVEGQKNSFALLGDLIIGVAYDLVILATALGKAMLPDPVVDEYAKRKQEALIVFKGLVELARTENKPVQLTLDDSDLYNAFLEQTETAIMPVSTIQGVVIGMYNGVQVHMSFREEDRPSYAEV